MEPCAQEKGMKTLYLLTTTAADYFPNAWLSDHPTFISARGIAAAEGFRNLCPATAVFLCKQLEP
jgi:hypothetical protein